MRFRDDFAGDGMNILLVEDDAGIARFVSRGLANCGYRVDCLREGAGVTMQLRERSYDAVLLDLGLPDMDGLDLAEDIQRESAETAIIMLTARGALQDRLDGFARGADDYLAKPFSFDELLARLAAVLRRRRVVPDIACGSLIFEQAVGRFRLDGRVMPLARREFDLLARLAREAGSLVRRDDLISGVWPDSPDVSDNVLDVYIGYLRRRLHGAAGAPGIETVRGQGFRLAPPQT